MTEKDNKNINMKEINPKNNPELFEKIGVKSEQIDIQWVEKIGYWSIVWAQFKKKKLAMLGLYCIALLIFIGTFAPVFTLDKPFYASIKGDGIYFPWFKSLFDEEFFKNKVDIFFNLLMLMSPFYIAAFFTLKKKLGKAIGIHFLKISFSFILFHLILFAVISQFLYGVPNKYYKKFEAYVENDKKIEALNELDIKISKIKENLSNFDKNSLDAEKRETIKKIEKLQIEKDSLLKDNKKSEKLKKEISANIKSKKTGIENVKKSLSSFLEKSKKLEKDILTEKKSVKDLKEDFEKAFNSKKLADVEYIKLKKQNENLLKKIKESEGKKKSDKKEDVKKDKDKTKEEDKKEDVKKDKDKAKEEDKKEDVKKEDVKKEDVKKDKDKAKEEDKKEDVKKDKDKDKDKDKAKEEDKKEENVKKAVAQIKKEQKELQKKIIDVEKKIKEYQKIIEKKLAIDKKIEELESSKSRNKDIIANFAKRKLALQEEIDKIETQLKKLSGEIAANLKKLEILKEEEKKFSEERKNIEQKYFDFYLAFFKKQKYFVSQNNALKTEIQDLLFAKEKNFSREGDEEKLEQKLYNFYFSFKVEDFEKKAVNLKKKIENFNKEHPKCFMISPPLPHTWKPKTAEDVQVNQPPNKENLFGTDGGGRDVLAIMLFGTRVSLTIGVVAVSIYITIGIFIGALAGFYGGKIDLWISRFVEIMLCFPTFFLILTLAAFVTSPSIFYIMFIIGVTRWTTVARLIRGEFLRIKNIDYVQAAMALGLPKSRIIFGHILPNALGPILVSATFGIASSIVRESALSFLGLGDPTAPSWGRILSDGRLSGKAWLILIPGLSIFFVVCIFNLVGEGLRDALDPKLRQQLWKIY